MPSAVSDLTSIRNYIGQDNWEVANDVVMRIVEQAESLAIYPQKGRIGRIQGSRESILPGLPYIIAYRPKQDAVEIVRIIHTSRQWPKRIK